MVGRSAPPLLLVAGHDLRQVQLIHEVGDEIGQVILGQPFLQGLWQQQLLVGIVGKVGLAHWSAPLAECSSHHTCNNRPPVFLGQAASRVSDWKPVPQQLEPG